jgi:hypothetical protein
VSGGAVQTYVNTNGATGVWAIQAALYDSSGTLVGSSTAAFL